MAGQSANETRSEISKRLNELDCSKSKPSGSGSSPHGNDHYKAAGGGKKKHEIGK